MLTRLLLTVILFQIISSCSDPEKKENQKQVFRYNESAGITSLDPAFASNQANIWACTQLFNGLVQLDSTLQPRPCIAKTGKSAAMD